MIDFTLLGNLLLGLCVLMLVLPFFSHGGFEMNGGLGKNYAWEVEMLKIASRYRDGLIPLKVDINFEWFRGDHRPGFLFEVIVMNVVIIEFNIYNIWHEDSINYSSSWR